MTIIECFENAPFENTISALTANPQKIIYIGDDPHMEERANKHKEFLNSKHIFPTLEFCYVDKNDLQQIVRELSAIILKEDDCIVDISGGEDLVLMAVGMVYQQYHQTHPFQLQRVDVASGRIIDCDGDHFTPFTGKVKLTVEELIALHGGVVVPENPQPSPQTDAADINLLWGVSKQDSGKWNKFIGYLNEFCDKKNTANAELTVRLNIPHLRSSVKDFNLKYETVQTYLRQLENAGLIYNYQASDRQLNFTYKNAVVSRAMNRAGNVLEMKVYFEARDLIVDGIPYYDSCYLGVNIDWDGVIHSTWQQEKDTRNEIDVVLMRGLTPVFISCKNGTIHEGEPYKLCAVAHRFGGKHAKKALIATDFAESRKAELSLLQRASDMDFTFVPEAAQLSETDWKNLLIQLA